MAAERRSFVALSSTPSFQISSFLSPTQATCIFSPASPAPPSLLSRCGIRKPATGLAVVSHPCVCSCISPLQTARLAPGYTTKKPRRALTGVCWVSTLHHRFSSCLTRTDQPASGLASTKWSPAIGGPRGLTAVLARPRLAAPRRRESVARSPAMGPRSPQSREPTPPPPQVSSIPGTQHADSAPPCPVAC